MGKREIEYLLNDIEFPANVYPFLNLKDLELKLIL
jgi:hypothetical protein